MLLQRKAAGKYSVHKAQTMKFNKIDKNNHISDMKSEQGHKTI